MKTLNLMKKEIISLLAEQGLSVNHIKARGFNKEHRELKSITISLDSIDNGGNTLYTVKEVLDSVEDKYEVYSTQRLLDF